MCRHSVRISKVYAEHQNSYASHPLISGDLRQKHVSQWPWPRRANGGAVADRVRADSSTVKTDRRAFYEDFVNLMYRRRDVRAAFDTYVAVDYIQHNPGLPDGRDAARDALAEKFGDPEFSIAVERMLVDGDVCALHLRAHRADGTDAAVVDIYRADGDHIVEHWDVIQPWPAASANDHPMF
jgi:predicted SnoaL-like aldol condensation-catalyzing enzyme